ncbi:hypothetical protein EUX98_g4793 [Antrodiella citrinella]|uniref:Sacsin/Nov domain-containing protein n=1 Tax=Antrodiella citrinella TaxID=2447956 RepID=A0A4S4MT44_9APHY|nr:hypothetical protein EUX98_g4793 [Antrodiella citrinella]
MAEDFGQSAKPTAAIRNILDTYPFSIGILREILQNSDDAGATRQVFASDSRTHPTTHLLSDQLSGAQGHALLAYNNTVFLENEQTNDWEALQNINESSKRTDTSKHGGKRVDLTQDPIKYSDHVHAMDLDVLDSSFTSGDVLNGTVIRLPLRQPGHNSEISGKTLTAMEIRQLFLDFIQDELGIALLFLRHLKSITFLEVDNHGTRCIGQAEFGKTPIGSPNGTTTQEIVSVDKLEPGRLTWRVVHVDFADSECANILERRLSRNVSEDLQREKLSPAVSLAFPMPLQPPSRSLLFTYLPLPLPTGFPCHIHSLFALTPSRQNLRNAVEQGLVHGARDELLVEWNKVLFEHFIPRAWGASLELLAHSCSNPLDLWQAWPPASQDTPGGDPFYWRQLVLNLTRVLIDEDRPIWPLIGSNAFARASHVLAASHDDQQYLSSLVTSGVQITLPPLYVLHTMDLLGSQERKLTPKSARKILMMNVARVQRTSSLEKDSLTRFLLSEGDPAMLAGLPIIPFMNGDYIALQPNAQAGGTLHALLDDEAASVFEVGSGNFIPISRVPANFITTSPAVLNVTTLGCAQVIGYLEVIVNQLDPSSLTAWLPQFWAWLTASSLRDQICDVLSTSNLRVLPDTKRDLHILKTIFFDTGEIDDHIQAVLSNHVISRISVTMKPFIWLSISPAA